MFEQVISEVDFTSLLRDRSVVFEEAGDAERVVELVELGGLEGDVGPAAVGVAGGVGIGEDDDLVIDQGRKHLGREHLEATTGQPETVGDALRADDGSLLALYHTDSCSGGFATEQVLTEEAAVKGIVLRELALQEGVNPCGVARLDAVTVGLIIHNLASSDALQFIYLPKDHTTIAGNTELVLLGGMAQLLVIKIGTLQEGLAEETGDGTGLLQELQWDEVGWLKAEG